MLVGALVGTAVGEALATVVLAGASATLFG
jgi:hypothetical protein